MTKPIIPIFYACDDNFVKYTIVSLHSMIRNASTAYRYHIYVLHTGISEPMMEKVLALKNDCFEITFENVTVGGRPICAKDLRVEGNVQSLNIVS